MTATFEDWVDAVFHHPAEGPQWYWGDAFNGFWEPYELPDALLVEYLTRLFLDPEQLRYYSLAQVAQGIWFLIGESSPAAIAHVLIKSEATLEQRSRCVRAMATFFQKFVVPAAPGPAEVNSDPFRIACYMWWDIFPSFGGRQAGEPALHQACLETMADILKTSSELCQVSALHGLCHWHLHYPAEVERTVDAFLRETRELSPLIQEYGTSARSGCCQ